MEIQLKREETIAEHRKMWKWIKEKTLERKKCVIKDDYFKENGIKDIPLHNCFCCEYVLKNFQTATRYLDCKKCPIQWFGIDCCADGKVGEYVLWHDAVYRENNYEKAAAAASLIAELSERSEYK